MAMTTSEIKLLGLWPSPFVNRIQLALKVKSIEYEFVETNPHTKTELLLKTNPIYEKIPVLIHAQNPICESLVIVQYIDDAWPNVPSMLPSDPYDRALARFWAGYIDGKWFPLFQQLKDTEGEEAREAVTEKISEGLMVLEEAFMSCSKGKDYFGGDNVGYLDIVLGSTIGWVRVTEILIGKKFLDEIKTPHLVGWYERLYSESCVKDIVLQTQPLLDVYRKSQGA